MRKRIICCFMAFGILFFTYTHPASAQQSPQTIYTGETFSVSAGDASDIQWSLKRDNTDVPLAGNIEGALTNSGGTIRFPLTGMYTLIASITDATGRVFTNSRTVSVQNALNCDFNLSTTNTHIKNNVTVTMAASANTGGKTISWSLTKDGSGSGYTGTLNNSGGNIKMTSTGTFTLTASLTDDTGKTVTCSKNFTTYNTAPSKPVITRTPNDSLVNCNDQIRITATASDPDGDSVTLVWENRPSEYATYALGTHTVRVKARDAYGLESGWASTVFTSKLLYEEFQVKNHYSSSNYKTYTAPSGGYIDSFKIIVPPFNYSSMYTYNLDSGYYSTNDQQWTNSIGGIFDSNGKTSWYLLGSRSVTSVRFRLTTSDSALNNLTIVCQITYIYP